MDSRLQIGVVTVVAVVGVLIALLHGAAIDTFIIVVEWLLFIALVAATYLLYVKRSTPVCHIIYVRRDSQGDYRATTEYYRVSLYGGQALAQAIAKAQADPQICSITYYERSKQLHIPMQSAKEPVRTICTHCEAVNSYEFKDGWFTCNKCGAVRNTAK